MGHVMISYSRDDSSFVELLESDLNEYRHQTAKPWRDQSDLIGGTDWQVELRRAIAGAYVVIVVCSKHSNESEWVKNEVKWAEDSAKPIIPIQLESGAVPLALRLHQLIDFSGVTHSAGFEQVKHYRIAFDKLVRGVDRAQPIVRFRRELNSPDLRRRAEAAAQLGRSGELDAVEPLIEALTSMDANIRFESARALGRLKGPAAIRSLLTALADEDEDVVAVSAWALGQLQAVEAVSRLIELLPKSDRIVRERAARALGRIFKQREGEGSAAVRPLVGLLRSDPISTVRDAAREALVNVGGSEAERALAREALFDETAMVNNERVSVDLCDPKIASV